MHICSLLHNLWVTRNFCKIANFLHQYVFNSLPLLCVSTPKNSRQLYILNESHQFGCTGSQGWYCNLSNCVVLCGFLWYGCQPQSGLQHLDTSVQQRYDIHAPTNLGNLLNSLSEVTNEETSEKMANLDDCTGATLVGSIKRTTQSTTSSIPHGTWGSIRWTNAKNTV